MNFKVETQVSKGGKKTILLKPDIFLEYYSLRLENELIRERVWDPKFIFIFIFKLKKYSIYIKIKLKVFIWESQNSPQRTALSLLEKILYFLLYWLCFYLISREICLMSLLYLYTLICLFYYTGKNRINSILLCVMRT